MLTTRVSRLAGRWAILPFHTQPANLLMIIKAFIVLVLLAIIGSLGSGLVFLVKDHGQSTRTVKALTVRIALSVSLFALLMLGYALGLVKPHGIYPQPPTTQSGQVSGN